LLGIGTSLAAVVYLAMKVNVPEIVRAFHHLNWTWLFCLTAMYLSSFIPRGMRWQIMLGPIKKIPLNSAVSTIIIGFMANNLLPARLGEIVRAFVLNRTEKIGTATSLVSILVERLFDCLTLLVVLVASAHFAHFEDGHHSLILRIELLASGLFALAFGGILFVRFAPDVFTAILRRSFFFLPEKYEIYVSELSGSIQEAVCFFRFNRNFFAFLLLSIAVWAIEGAVFWLGLACFGIEQGPALAYFTLAVVNFGILIPSAPGYLGVFQTCAMLAFQVFGLGAELAVGYSVVIHALQFLPVSLLGLFLLNTIGIRFKEIQTAKA